MNMRQLIDHLDIKSQSSGYEDTDGAVPELNRLTFTNICREIDLANGARPSVHKAAFEPGEYQEFRKKGKVGWSNMTQNGVLIVMYPGKGNALRVLGGLSIGVKNADT